MANRISVPSMARTQKSMISGARNPEMPTIDFRSGLKDVGTAIQNTADFTETYTKLRYEQYQAKMQNLEMQQLHEMEDASDPCELEEINKKYEKAYNTLLGDDYFTRSYYKSRFYQNWQTQHQANQQKAYLAKQHEFEDIQAVATLNEMASTMALYSDPRDMHQILKNGEAMLDGIGHMTAKRKFELMSAFYEQSVGKLMTANPNAVITWLDYAGNSYDEYGLDSNALRQKVSDYNKAKLNEAWTEYQREKIITNDRDNKLANAYVSGALDGSLTREKAQQLANEANDNVSILVAKGLNSVFEKPKVESKTMTELKTHLVNGTVGEYLSKPENLVNVLSDSEARVLYHEWFPSEESKIDYDLFEKAVQDYLDNGGDVFSISSKFELQGQTKTLFDKYFENLKEIKDDQQQDIKESLISKINEAETLEQLKAIKGDIKNARIKTKYKNEATKELDSRMTKLQDKQTEQTEKESAELYNNLLVKMKSANNIQDLEDALKGQENLLPADREKFINEFYAKMDKLKTENKLTADEEKKLNQSVNFLKFYDKDITTEEAEEFVRTEAITQDQATKLLERTAKRAETKSNEEQEKAKGAFWMAAFNNWNKGELVIDIPNYIVKNRDDLNFINSENEKVRADMFSAVKLDIISELAQYSLNNPYESHDGKRNFLNEFIKYHPNRNITIKGYQKEYDKFLSDIDIKKNEALSSAITQLKQQLPDYGEKRTELETKALNNAIAEVNKAIKNDEKYDIYQIANKNKISLKAVNEEKARLYRTEQELNIFKNRIFKKVDVSKDEDEETRYGYELRDGIVYIDVREYARAVNLSELAPKEKEERKLPIMQNHESIIKNLLSNNDTVIEQSATWLKTKLYPIGDILNYTGFYEELNKIADYLENNNIPLNVEENVIGSYFKGMDLNVETLKGLLDKYWKDAYSNDVSNRRM